MKTCFHKTLDKHKRKALKKPFMLNHFLQNYIKSGKKRITIYLSFIVSHLSFSEALLRAWGGLFHFSFKFNHLSELQEIVFGPDLYFLGISDKWQNVCLYLIDVSCGKTFVQLFKE